MAEGELDHNERQCYELSIRQLQTMLEAQRRVQRVAEGTSKEAMAQMERIAIALCPQVVDDFRRKSPLGITPLSLRETADTIIHEVKRRLLQSDAAEAAGRGLGELYEEATAKLTRLEKTNARLEGQLDEERGAKEEAELRLTVLQQSLEDAQRRLGEAPPLTTTAHPASEETSSPEPSSVSPERLPKWVRWWQEQPTYARDEALLQVLAETGLARRVEAAELFAARTDLAPRGGGVGRAFRRCERMDLVELIEVQSDTSGSSIYHLVRLTEKGQDAYRMLFGQEPAPSQATELLARHKSGSHALLNLEAADLLREAGYEVDLFLGRVKLPGDRIFAPDLAASWQGRTLFVEVERETRKSSDERERKWHNYYDASGGEFYVVCSDRSAMEAIQSEISFWAGRRSLVLWMTSVSDAKEKKGEAVWLHKRGRPK